MTATPRDWLFMMSLGMIWGASFMATRVVALELAPLTIAALRLVLAAAVIRLVLALWRERLPGLATREERLFWLAATGMAFFSNAMPFTALSWGQRFIDSGLAGVFMASVPLFVLPLGHLFVPGERMTARKVAGFLLGFAGVAVLMGPSVLLELGGGPAIALFAQAACLCAAFGYAAGSIVSKRAPQLGLLRFGAAALTIAAAMTLPLALVVEGVPRAMPSTGAVLSLLYLGLVPTALATVLLLSVIRSAGPGFLSLVNYLVPLWAVVFGVAVLGESPSPRLGLALVLILGGLALAQARLGLRRGGHARG
jgi:drug/metabolite transporter (DMT)-like permease